MSNRPLAFLAFAIFSDEDEARWRQIMAEEEAFYAGEE